MSTDYKNIVKNNSSEIIRVLQELVHIPSVLTEFNPNSEYPFGKDINDALNYMIDLAKKDGFDAQNIDNYAGEITYGEGGDLVGILCHLDVVPTGDGWKHGNPFSGIIEDNKMYGRGTSDDKGPTVAAYFALKIIKDLGIKLKNTIRIILGTDEETGWRGVEHYFNKRPVPDYGFAPDADFPLIYGEKGRETFDLTADFDKNDNVISLTGGERYNVVLEEVKALVKIDIRNEFEKFALNNNLDCRTSIKNGNYELVLRGVPSHGAMPELGKNAGTYMCTFLKDYSNNKMIHYIADKMHLGYFFDKINADYDDYEMKKITCNIGILNISEESTRVTFDVRYPVRYPQEKHDNILKSFEEYGIKIIDHTNKEPHYVSPDDPLVTKLYDAYLKNTFDYEHKPFTIGGGTYAGTLPKGVAFGMLFPNEEELAHQCDECVDLDSLFTTVAIYIDAILALGEIDA